MSISEIQNYENASTELRLVQVSDSFDDHVAKVASIWVRVALEKALVATEKREQEQFRACAKISSLIADSHNVSPNYGFSYVCYDAKGQPQGIMILAIHSDQVEVARIVTNPNNIRSCVNKNQVRGAGTCLLQEAEKLAMNEGKESVYLFPLDEANDFYEKNGFLQTGDDIRIMTKKIQKVSQEFFQSIENC